MKINMSAADIRVFLAENLPYYESEDKDDFLYIVKAVDIERISLKLYRHLTSHFEIYGELKEEEELNQCSDKESEVKNHENKN